MGGAYAFSKDAAANLRKKDDSYNSAIGGAIAGSMMGLSRTSKQRTYTMRDMVRILTER